MDIADYSFILVAYVVAAAIKGVTGIGFSTSCLPIMALRLDLKVAIPLVIVPSVLSNIVLIFDAGSFGGAVRRFWPLYLASVPGLLIGLSVLMRVDVEVAKVILGIVLVLYSLASLRHTALALPEQWETLLKVPVGFCTGLINGLTGSQVMPVLPYLLSLKLSNNFLVQAINISFTMSSLIMLVGLNRAGYVTASSFLTAIGGIIPVLLMVFLGGRLRRRLSARRYRNLVLSFLLIMGLILSLRPFF